MPDQRSHVLHNILGELHFFKDFTDDDLHRLAALSSIMHFKPGSMLAREGESAEYFYALVTGRVAIETSSSNRHNLMLQTVKSGDVVGWSWNFTPYRWTFDARALVQTEAIALSAPKLRELCAQDPRLELLMTRKLARVLIERLQATRLQLLDVYGNKFNP
jgi:CRP/FNR family cyclic AMP-dependent transcriptional regulator